MSFRDRLNVLSRAAVGLFSETSATEARGLLMGITPGAVGYAPARNAQQFLQAYGQIPWLRAVTDKIATSFSSVQWKLYAIRKPASGEKARYRPEIQRANKAIRKSHMEDLRRLGELDELTRHPFYDMMASGNSFQTGEQMRKVTMIHFLILGEFFWLKERNGVGAPTAAWPVPPPWVTSTPTPTRRSFRVGYRSWRDEVPDTEMFWFTDPNTENPYERGTGIAQTLNDEYETDEFAAKTTRQWFQNSAKPELIISGKGISEGQAKKIEADWNARNKGFWNRFRTHILGGADLKITELDMDFRSQQFIQLRQFARDIALQTWGMPPEILGLLESSNRATIESADFFFSHHVLEPRLEFFRGALQERMIPEWDERLIVDYESPVQEDKTFQLQAATAAPWSLTVDDWRERQGLQPLEKDTGKVFLVPFNLIATRDFVMPPPRLLAPPPGAPPALPGEPAPKRLRALRRASVETGWRGLIRDDADVYAQAKDTESVRWAWKQMAGDPENLPELSRIAGRLEPSLRTSFLQAVAESQAAIDLEALASAVLRRQITDVEIEAQLVALASKLDGLTPILRQGFLAGAQVGVGALGSAGIGLSFDLVSPHAVAWAERNAGELITGILDEQRQMVAAAVAQGQQTGQSAQQVAGAIQQYLGLTDRQAAAVQAFEARLFDAGVAPETAQIRVSRYAEALGRQRAQVVARTELITSSNAGQHAAWNEARAQGLITGTERKVWETAEDERVCPICMALDGEQVGLNELFSEGIMFPPPHPQCRCSTSLVFA